jgi:hypothetical protein
MLEAYEEDHQTGMDASAVAGHIYYYTSGYPFLVSSLCKIIDEENLDWTKPGIDKAVQIILKENNTLFEDVVKNIVNHPSFSSLVEKLIVDGANIVFENANPDINLGMMYGVLKNSEGKVSVSNIIFETIIFNYLTSVASNRELVGRYTDEHSQFVQSGHLDMAHVIKRFAEFMKSEYRDEDSAFIEQEARLLFLSFLKPIINGTGHYAVEPETRGRRRMDIVVFFGNEKYIVELKVWHGEKAAEKAYEQLTGYLNSQGQSHGYLLSFTDNLTAPRAGGTFEYDGYTITEEIVAYRDKE